MKKHIALILVTILSSFQLDAQPPQGFNYQATVRNNTGELLVNQNANFQFTIVQGSPTGTSLYVETHTAQSDDLGQVVLRIGQGSSVSGGLSQIDWSLGSYYLAIELDTGSGYVSMGTTQFLSVPYALYADTAGNVEALQTQIDELVLLTDADNDGFSENQGDCDDTNATVYPGATEDESDGVDNDCDGEVDEALGYNATFYYFHGGAGTYPFEPSGVLTASSATYYTYDSGNYTTTTDFGVSLADMIANSGTTQGGNAYPVVGTFNFAGPMTGDNGATTWTYPVSAINEYYYVAVPVGSNYPENLTTATILQDTGNGFGTNANGAKAFTMNGNGYILYKLAVNANTVSATWAFK